MAGAATHERRPLVHLLITYRLNDVSRIAVHLKRENGCPAQPLIAQ